MVTAVGGLCVSLPRPLCVLSLIYCSSSIPPSDCCLVAACCVFSRGGDASFAASRLHLFLFVGYLGIAFHLLSIICRWPRLLPSTSSPFPSPSLCWRRRKRAVCRTREAGNVCPRKIGVTGVGHGRRLLNRFGYVDTSGPPSDALTPHLCPSPLTLTPRARRCTLSVFLSHHLCFARCCTESMRHFSPLRLSPPLRTSTTCARLLTNVL